ncbi:MAG: F0F1 ATP synthase subunit alpha [Candidatus Omnitrophica bacterium]|nr:F0F1 ATP synthase subunit alpha [Candidatus Omnitrophota bacterium]
MKIESVSIGEIGRVKEVKKSVVKIEGLQGCMLGQLVTFLDGTRGFVMGFNESEVLVLLLGISKNIKAGNEVYSKEESFKIPVGNNFLGRIVSPLGDDLDGKGHIKEDSFAYIFRDAPAVLDREPIDQMLVTGIRIVDSTIPIGRGQRQLIIGDRMTGKTTIAVDAILNQKLTDTICIYCCVGRDYNSFEKVVSTFKEKGALNRMIVVAALASSSIGEQYLAPYAAATLGEYFMYSGKDVLVVFDDLTKHAWAYRELSLLMERPPGREAYPGDIFYLHAQLMERAARLSSPNSGGSMTFLPIADTLQGDIAGFIPTNLISMTDGQIYLSSLLFGEGFKPAIDIGLSVSRIGNRVQQKNLRELTMDLKLIYIQYRELLKTTRLRSGISEELTKRLRRGEKIERIFMQDKNSPSTVTEQIILYFALREGVLDTLSNAHCEHFKANILAYVRSNSPALLEKIDKGAEMTGPDKEELKKCIMNFDQSAWVDRRKSPRHEDIDGIAGEAAE